MFRCSTEDYVLVDLSTLKKFPVRENKQRPELKEQCNSFSRPTLALCFLNSYSAFHLQQTSFEIEIFSFLLLIEKKILWDMCKFFRESGVSFGPPEQVRITLAFK